MITPSFGLTATERVLPKLALDFTTALLDSRITFVRTTDATRPATYINSSGYITDATNNQPRFDYTYTTGICRGLLIEESRANLLTYSENFNSWNKTKVTVNETANISPRGTQTGNKIITTGTTGNHYISLGNITLSASTTYTLTVRLKAAEYGWALIYIGTVGVGQYINLLTGDKGSTFIGAPTSCITTWIKDDWLEINLVFASGVNTSCDVRIYAATANNTNNFLGDNSSGIYAWGAQLEAGAFATSYIPTTTTSLTRNADVVSMTGTNFSDWYNASEGTFAVNCDTRSGHVFNANDGTSNNRIALFGQLSMFAAVGGVTEVNQAVGVTSNNVLFGATMSYKLNSYLASLNGAASVSDTSATVPTVNQLSIGTDQSTSNYINGHIAKFLYWPMQLTANEVRAFSKLG